MISSKTDKGAAADEKDIGRIHLQKFLLRVLPAALGRNARHRPFNNLQQSLLHAFAGNISRNRWIVRFPRNFIDLIDIDDAALSFFNVVVGSLQKVQNNIFNVLTDISRLSQAGRIGDRKRHLQKPRKSLRQKCFSRPGRTEQQNIAFLQLDVAGNHWLSMRL